MQITEQIRNQSLQSIKKYKIVEINKQNEHIFSATISNNLKYIVSGVEDGLLKIWDYQRNKLIQQIKFHNLILNCKFTDDSKLLYVCVPRKIYKLYVNNEFKKLCQVKINSLFIYNIYCISYIIIFTQKYENHTHIISKLDVYKQKQLLQIYAHNDQIDGLDYNKGLNIIASGSHDKSIKLWNGSNGSLIIERLKVRPILQVLLLNNNQLISFNYDQNLIKWNINYQNKQLEKLQLIKGFGLNISLVLQQQYIITTGIRFIKVYSIKGEFVRKFDHEDNEISSYNTIQHDSMKAILIQGLRKLCVCQVDMD